MSAICGKIRRFLTSEDGPTAVEYAVLVGLIVIGIVAAVSALASQMSGTFSSVSSTLAGS
jgi:pilus assembly protein Flp/PilA